MQAMNDLKQLIKSETRRLGFAHCGVAQSGPLEYLRPFFSEFIVRMGHYPDLRYLETNLEKRLHPELVLPGVKTVVALLMNYDPGQIIATEDNFVIARYAYGNDYHVIMRNRMKSLADFITSMGDGIRVKTFVDSGAILEKAWAQKCGVGWQGKNTLIINKSAGSFFFIGILLTDLELEPDVPETDHCAGCRKCIDACPTGALNTPYQLDIPKCISYLTIESKQDIPDDLKSKLNDRIYGCDLCQDVCPYNRFAGLHPVSQFQPSEEVMQLRKADWLAMTEPDFDRIFASSPVRRIGYEKMMRNIQAAL